MQSSDFSLSRKKKQRKQPKIIQKEIFFLPEIKRDGHC